MIDKAINYLVRFAALISAYGLITGFRPGDTNLKIMEIFMLLIWAQMDYKRISSLIKKDKD